MTLPLILAGWALTFLPVGNVPLLMSARSQSEEEALFLGSFFPAGNDPDSIAVGDLNRDGVPDLAIGNESPVGTVTVLLGDGHGGYGSPHNFVVGSNTEFVALAHMDGDHDLDLVAANLFPDEVSVSFGDGLGGFGPAAHFPTGPDPVCLDLADFDGDGFLDAVTADKSPSETQSGISILLGDGQGGFVPPYSIDTGEQPTYVRSGDFNLDGKPDVAVVNTYSFTLSILLNTGSGMGSPVDYETAIYPGNLAVGDVNEDGIPDLGYTANLLVWLRLGDGQGGFGPATSHSPLAWPAHMAIGDLTADGHADLVTVSKSSANLSILPGAGTGAFDTARCLTVGRYPRFVAIAQLDQDERPDAVVANWFSRDVALLRGGRLAVAQYPTQLPFSAAADPYALAAGDLDRDGRTDLVVVNNDANSSHNASVSVLVGDGQGGFEASWQIETDSRHQAIALDDFDSDGELDAVVPILYADQVLLLLGEPGPGFRVGGRFPVGSDPVAVVTSDLNGDGASDVVVCNFLPGSISVLLGDGLGGFAQAIEFPSILFPLALAVADLDGDGISDLAIGNGGSTGELAIQIGDGQGGFGAPIPVLSASSPQSVAIGDLDGDGNLDLAAASFGDERLYVLLGDGHGGFAELPPIPLETQPSDVAIADLNDDGAADIVTADYGSDRLSVILGNGEGGFEAPIRFPTGSYPIELAVADFDFDGRPDIAAANLTSGFVSVLVNQRLDPAGIERFGRGTAGCTGMLGMSADPAPAVGEQEFALACTNAPPLSTGWVFLTDAADLEGSFPFGPGLRVHLDLAAASVVVRLPIRSDSSGVGRSVLRIPADPRLAGTRYYAQAFWRWPECAFSPRRASSSRAISIEIQP